MPVIDILVAASAGVEITQNEEIRKGAKWIGKKAVQGVKALGKAVKKPRSKQRTKK